MTAADEARILDPRPPLDAPTRERAAVTASVVICVYTEQRWPQLCAAIDSACAQQPAPPVDVLVVVDHNEALLARLRARHQDDPLVRVLPNAHAKGLSGGRNTGAEAAHGEVVAFLDDDATAEPDWLSVLTSGYDDPSVMGVGGRTLPVWASGRRPGWYPEEFDWVHGASYRGMPVGRARVRNVLGGNASFRRSAFAVTGGFPSGIGRGAGTTGAAPGGGEETELCIRIQQARPDASFRYDDRAVIHHHVPPERERFRYLCRRCWAEGLSKAQVTAQVGATDGLATERAYVRRVLPAGVARGLRDVLRGQPDGLGRAGAITAGLLITACGYAAGLRARRHAS
ncbi:glycosyltransferase family 2 protein [Streptacidiphilus fuscans]|uniref:Glycosyltransferase family 2 protein n=1 Tax=Streptacidiphilus fuscans TaxID=2789292 RepID=A0A931FF59_9ACTN|nr:glycosyltransferase family 2 protein [Streptacidiphilus fuscans]MBF9071283.1 glycosyltransferase family 2 protein [Streptacidiphilus fuscans]